MSVSTFSPLGAVKFLDDFPLRHLMCGNDELRDALTPP